MGKDSALFTKLSASRTRHVRSALPARGGGVLVRNMLPASCRYAPPEAGIRLTWRGRSGLLVGRGSSDQGHVMVSPAAGRKRRENEPLKQCLKNT